MIIQPKIRGFICTTAHPEGCRENVRQQIEQVKKVSPFPPGPKKVLVIGSSTGFGLSSRIVSTFGQGAATIGVFFEKPSERGRTASPGWYSSAAFEGFAHQEGHYARSLNGDAFSDEVKDEIIQIIKEDLGQIDMLIYSLASPRRTHPKSGKTFRSTLKPIESAYHNKTLEPYTGIISNIELEPATQDEIDQTIAVMGGEDWEMWIDALDNADVLAPDFSTIAYSYLGPKLNQAIYRNGTIGAAKADLEKTSQKLDERLKKRNGRAIISMNKALLTQASAAIPVIPLYVTMLYKVMKDKNVHEGCLEQIIRLFKDKLYSQDAPLVDKEGRIRMDDWELRTDVQEEVERCWRFISTENVMEQADLEGYRHDFLKLFGFDVKGVDYNQDVDPVVNIPSMMSRQSK